MVQTSENASPSFLWSPEVVPVTAGASLVCDGGKGPEGAQPSPGLSLVHICPQAQERYAQAGGVDELVRVTWAVGGNCTRVKWSGSTGRNGPGGVRGLITGFSRHSRLNCIAAFNSVDRSKVRETWFITLTIPAGECDWKQIERHRAAWSKRLRRHWGTNCCGFWRKEPHASGYPHLHVLLMWLGKPPKLERFKRWNDRAWADVVKSEHPAHERVGCRVEQMRRWEGAAWYLAEYLTKHAEFEGVLNTGRQWGRLNEDVIPVRIESADVPAEVGRRVHRVLRRLQQEKRRKVFAWLHDERRGVKRWERLRDSVLKSTSGRVLGYQTVDDQIAILRRAGVKVREWRPKCAVTLNVAVWRDVFDGAGKHCGWERGDDEKITKLAGLFLVSPVLVKRLVDHYMREFERAAPF